MDKVRFLTMMLAVSSCITSFATGIDGFYRVQNYGSTHYLYIKDCTGTASSSAQDFDAIEALEKDANTYSDPGSVMYLTKSGSDFDITSQNTGIYKMTGSYVALSLASDQVSYLVYCSGLYLYDIGSDVNNPGQDYTASRTYVRGITDSDMPAIKNKTSYKKWTVTAISNSSDNYFGFKPTVTANGRYYAPFFADFAYTPVSSSVKTWYVSKIDKTRSVAVVKEITGMVAKSQPVFVECIGTTAADNKVDLSTEAGTAATSNLLKGTYFCNGERSSKTHTGDKAVVPFDPKTMRVLGTDENGNLAFVSGSTNLVNTTYYNNGVQTTGLCIPHNTSYLTVDADCPATLKVMTEEEYRELSAINVVTSTDKPKSHIYDVQGRKISSESGQIKNNIYIIDGRKVVKQ